MALDEQDLNKIKRLLAEHWDDIAVHIIGRTFERLEERIDAAESRICGHLSEIEDRIETSRQDLSDELGLVRDSVRDIAHANDQAGDVDPLPTV